MRRHLRWLGTCALAAALVAGCASDDGDQQAGSGTGNEGPADTPSTTADVAGGPDAPARPSPGCADPRTDAVQVERVELVSGGVSRTYLVTAPDSGGEPAPLVLDLHGLMEGADVHAGHSGLGEFGQEHGFITVFPHGTGEPVAWNVDPGEQNPDLVYLDAVIDRVAGERCVDEARIYATGLSNGAMMTSLLACERSERIAAVSPVGGVAAPEPCEQSRPVPMLATHGTADPILQFNGGVDVSGFLGDGNGDGATTTTQAVDLDGEGYPATVATWAERYGCDPEPSEERIAESVLERSYDCPAGVELGFVVVEGGGHNWPGSEFARTIEDITGPTTFEIDWNELAWEFFQRHRLP